MRGISENQKATAVRATALVAATLFFIPAQSFAIHINVPAAKARMQHQIVVSFPDKQLVLLQDGQILKTYQVAVGADVSRSPEGDFTVINRLENPTYFTPGKIIGPGKSNPLGTRWMGLSKKGYGIHGTNVPSSIGKAASHGCIRMRQRDLEELFAMVQVGDKVMFRDAQMTALLTPPQTQQSDVQVAVATNGDVTANATPTISADGEDKF
jgi:lipoprotein-anchoring transpeptidase ErfK/SrfK